MKLGMGVMSTGTYNLSDSQLNAASGTRIETVWRDEVESKMAPFNLIPWKYVWWHVRWICNCKFCYIESKLETTRLREIDIKCGLELLLKLKKGNSIVDNINSDPVTMYREETNYLQGLSEPLM